MNKKLKITFAPGAFDSFEGTQEELDAFIKEIEDSFHSGEFLSQSQEVDLDELEKSDPELAKQIRASIDPNTRKLN